MKKVCKKCNYIGQEEHEKKIFLYSGVLLIVWSLITLPSQYASSPINGIISFIIWLSFGMISLYFYIKKPDTCPKCKNKKTMIPLDTPKAQALIKEHNLTIPEEPIETSEPKAPWQTS